MINTFINELNLLYVEDEPSVRELLSKRLSRVVKNLYVAENGEQGYEKYLEHKPDMILTDISMPKMNGIDMSKKIREIDKSTPIIVLSAHSDSSFLLNAIEYGITSYLLKPIDRTKLFDVLEINAKGIFLNRVNIEQQKQINEQQVILQNIINSQESISFVTDFEKISFVNNAFLNFFDISDMSDFKSRYENVKDLFFQQKDYIHKGIVDNYNNIDNLNFSNEFFNQVNNLDETKRIVLLIDKYENLKSFYISISQLGEDKKLYLINLTDITKITIEKNLMTQKAYFDGLTNVYNRHKFNELFNIELARVRRHKHPLSIAILDIDHFKKFNDTYGHLIGDEILIMLAKFIESKLRITDVFARWGGEEFVILFIETKAQDAAKCSNMLRTQIEELNHEIAGKITVSFGITEYKDGDNLETLFHRCDEALYKAKENGRNRVELH